MSRIERKSAFRQFNVFRNFVRFIVAILHTAFAVEIARRKNFVPDRIILPVNFSCVSRVRVTRIQRRAADVAPAGEPLPDVRIHPGLILPDSRRHPCSLLKNQIQTCSRRQIAQTACTIVFPFAAQKLLQFRPRLRQSDFPPRIRVGNSAQTLKNMSLRNTRGEKRLRPELRFKITGNLKSALRRRQIETLFQPLICRLVFFHSASPCCIDPLFPAPPRRFRF